MHYYKRNLGDYAKKAGRLSMLQHGSYTLLLDACYDREQFPTEEEAIEWTWASTPEEEAAVRFVLKKFFVLEDGRYVQKRVQEELAEFHGKAETNKRIARERETKRKENSTNRARPVHVTSPDGHGPPPNQEPRTKNQEPGGKEERAPLAPAPEPPAARLLEPRASRLALEALPDDWAEFCRANRPDLRPAEVWESFRDHWAAKPGKDGRKIDWFATWRNWVRNEKARGGRPDHRPANDSAGLDAKRLLFGAVVEGELFDA